MGEWVLIGYLAQSLFVLAQAGLAAFLLVSGIADLFFYGRGGKWSKRFALVSKIPEAQRNLVGLTKLVLCLILLCPLVLGVTYMASVSAAIAVFFLLVWVEAGIEPDARGPGRSMRYLMMALAVISLSTTLFQRYDNLEAGYRIFSRAIKQRVRVLAWQKEENEKAPKVGEMATDFELLSADMKRRVRLSDFRNRKPVALIFGSHT